MVLAEQEARTANRSNSNTSNIPNLCMSESKKKTMSYSRVKCINIDNICVIYYGNVDNYHQHKHKKHSVH